MKIILFIIIVSTCFINCNQQSESLNKILVIKQNNPVIINDNGKTIIERFDPPEGFKRKQFPAKSFESYLQTLPLKPVGSKVKYYNGSIKDDYAYIAVVDMEISDKNLQQCADAVMRLRGEYFYKNKEYSNISFNLTNGFKVDFENWMKGNRVIINGNSTSWAHTANESDSYKTFRDYMEFVFAYAGSISLSKSMHSKNLEEISIGDVFIVGGSPGHVVLVVDMAENDSGEKVFILAQSYMPAQETQILKNLNAPGLSPWYSSNISGDLQTPEWTFKTNQLKTW